MLEILVKYMDHGNFCLRERGIVEEKVDQEGWRWRIWRTWQRSDLTQICSNPAVRLGDGDWTSSALIRMKCQYNHFLKHKKTTKETKAIGILLVSNNPALVYYLRTDLYNHFSVGDIVSTITAWILEPPTMKFRRPIGYPIQSQYVTIHDQISPFIPPKDVYMIIIWT